MDFRLTRIIMIDSYCPNRIAELDVSGHITINGENGAGKTTLLRLLPMFFGESPSKVIRQDAVTTKFSRYYFLSTASYLIFEYQRRTHKALAVIHADGQNDAVVYRLIDSDYKPELFMSGESLVQTGDLHRHLDKMGVFESKPLSLHHYRNIIQNTAGREHKNLASRFAFTGGTGKLTHIERIVTGILQRATNFYDLKKMIVSSILDDDKTFSLRTSKKDLLHWVSEYEAHHAVMEKLAVMTDLEQFDHQRRMSEADFSRLHARFKLLHDNHQNQEALAEEAEKAAKIDKVETDKSYGNRLRDLEDKKRAAESTTAQARSTLDHMEKRKKQFDDDKAEIKASAVDSLPGLNSELTPLEEQFEALKKEVKSISAVFDEMETATRNHASEESIKLEIAKSDAYQTSAEQRETLATLNQSQLKTIQERQKSELEEVSQASADLRVEESALLVEIRSARPDEEAQAALEVARQSQSDMTSILEKLHESTPALQRAWEKSKAAFEEYELQIVSGELGIEQIHENLDKLLTAGGANEDTLLGFLRRNKPNWVSDIGRIVSEDTLLRTDLSPVIGEGGDLYGIGIDLEKLKIGRFASEEAIQDEIKLIRGRLERKSSEVVEDKKILEKKHREMQAAKTSLNNHEAAISVAKNNKSSADQQVIYAKKSAEGSQKAAVAMAEEKLVACRLKLAAAETANQSVKTAHREEMTRVEASHAQSVKEANKALNDRIESIKAQIQSIDANLKEKLLKIASDRDECLRENNVSTEVRNRISARIEELKGEITEANGLRGYVTQYRDWMENIWPQRPAKEQEWETATTEVGRIKREQDALLKERHTVLTQKDEAVAKAVALTESHITVQRNVKYQMTALAHWPIDSDILNAGFDNSMTIESLSAERRRFQETLDACREKIREGIEEIRRQMCKEIGTGPERFHSTALKEIGHPRQGNEHEWIEVLRTWYNDRHHENRSSLLQLGKTMAQNISYFWKSLGDFKTNVNNFSTELKANLAQGQIFDSIADVTTEIKTHVDTQDYWDAVEALHHEYDAWHTLGDASLPPPSFVEAAKNVAAKLSEDKGLIAEPVDLISLKISANVNGQGSKTASNEHELANMSSNGLSYIILCVILIGFVNRIRRKEPVVIPFVVDELKDLSYLNAKTLLDLLERNNITMISAFPDVDLDLAELFGRNYKVLKGREVGLIDLTNHETDEAEEEPAHV